MIVKIKSKSDYLLDILNKNPDTDFGLYLTEHKNGVLVGNAVSMNQYDVLFLDTKHSYTNFESNQIDFKSLCDGRVVLAILGIYFKHLFNIDPQSSKIAWLDRTYAEIDAATVIEVENLWINSNWVENNDNLFLSKYLAGVSVEKKGLSLYRLRIEAESAFKAINLLAIVGFLIQATSDEALFLEAELLTKYVKILGNVKEAPYFIYYLLAKKLGDKFKHLLPTLQANFQKNSGLLCTLTPYSTQDNRINFIKSRLDTSNSILDFGCGEHSYIKALASRLDKEKIYFSHDRDVNFKRVYERLRDRYRDIDWRFHNNLNEIPRNIKLSVICSEVIEHNPLDEAKQIILNLVNNWTIQQLIITTPNIVFNQYYALDDGLRHDDHVQELDSTEFAAFIYSISSNYNCEFVDIGDVVNKEPVTLGAILTRK